MRKKGARAWQVVATAPKGAAFGRAYIYRQGRDNVIPEIR
jgi:hypothetical protein